MKESTDERVDKEEKPERLKRMCTEKRVDWRQSVMRRESTGERVY